MNACWSEISQNMAQDQQKTSSSNKQDNPKTDNPPSDDVQEAEYEEVEEENEKKK